MTDYVDFRGGCGRSSLPTASKRIEEDKIRSAISDYTVYFALAIAIKVDCLRLNAKKD